MAPRSRKCSAEILFMSGLLFLGFSLFRFAVIAFAFRFCLCCFFQERQLRANRSHPTLHSLVLFFFLCPPYCPLRSSFSHAFPRPLLFLSLSFSLSAWCVRVVCVCVCAWWLNALMITPASPIVDFRRLGSVQWTRREMLCVFFLSASFISRQLPENVLLVKCAFRENFSGANCWAFVSTELVFLVLFLWAWPESQISRNKMTRSDYWSGFEPLKSACIWAWDTWQWGLVRRFDEDSELHDSQPLLTWANEAVSRGSEVDTWHLDTLPCCRVIRDVDCHLPHEMNWALFLSWRCWWVLTLAKLTHWMQTWTWGSWLWPNQVQLTWSDSAKGDPSWVDREDCWAWAWAWAALLATLADWLVDFHWVWVLELPRIDALVHDSERAIDIQFRDAWPEFSTWEQKVFHMRMSLTNDLEDSLCESDLTVLRDVDDCLWHEPWWDWQWLMIEDMRLHEPWGWLTVTE